MVEVAATTAITTTSTSSSAITATKTIIKAKREKKMNNILWKNGRIFHWFGLPLIFNDFV